MLRACQAFHCRDADDLDKIFADLPSEFFLNTSACARYQWGTKLHLLLCPVMHCIVGGTSAQATPAPPALQGHAAMHLVVGWGLTISSLRSALQFSAML